MSSHQLTEQRVIDLISQHVSRINAKIIAERGRRVLKDPARISPDEKPRFLEAVKVTARLFVQPDQLDGLLRAIDGLNDDAAEAATEREIALRDEQDLRAARLSARELCEKLGAPSFVMQRVATAVSELARNIINYTPGGTITLTPRPGSPPKLSIVAEDQGSGIDNLDEIMGGRYRSKTGLGRGLLGVKQLMDKFDIRTGPRGTRIQVEASLR
jgi:serine/threonine-protein kinase RsbT